MASCQQEFDPGTPWEDLADFILWQQGVPREKRERIIKGIAKRRKRGHDRRIRLRLRSDEATYRFEMTS